jgi:GDP-D-mannose 3', 5'-epimerase
LGVRGRNSDNRLIAEKLGWKPSEPLYKGLEKTYRWIQQQATAARNGKLAEKQG